MADVDKLVAEMTVEEKAALTSGADLWSLVPIERLGIPAFRVTDGPNGARGSAMGTVGPTSVCVPCGSALGATWDPALVQRVGQMLGHEARTKACRVLLAPTVNLHRSPLAGRNFECYSEDPLLSGRMAAGFVRGVQSEGVVTTVKHFVANEAEFERHTISSVVDERTLRELYLVPFELAVKEGGTLGLMTAYNRLNGTYLTQRAEMLDDLLRGEWGFEGFVVTDWYAGGDTFESGRAGLDLEMPGPARFFGPALAAAVEAGRVPEADLDAKVCRLLTVFDGLGAFDDPPGAPERSEDRPEDRALAREAAAAATVLLRNDGVLPLDPARLRRVAVIGANATRAQMVGGGSAAVRPHYRTTPLDALRAALGPDVEVVWEPGADIDRSPPPLGPDELRTPDGEPGLAVSFYATPDLTGPVVGTTVALDTRFFTTGLPLPGLEEEKFSMRFLGTYTPAWTGPHLFRVAQAGRVRLSIDGQVVLDGIANPPEPGGEEFHGMSGRPQRVTVELEAGRAVPFQVDYTAQGSYMTYGFQVGCRPPRPDDLKERAVAAARDADAVIVIVGTNADWETEGRDRETLVLPGDQNELIRAVGAARPDAVVAVNTGGIVEMEWADEVGAVLQVWFGGQEMAGALADVLLGRAEPGGRLPTTIPHRIEHNPSYGNFPGAYGEVRYGEGLLVGYRWYDTRQLPVRYPFGHGLSFTTFELGPPVPSASTFRPGDELVVEVPVRNTGSRAGAEVVQCYVEAPEDGVFRPTRELRGWSKVVLEPGGRARVRVVLSDRAFAHWDPAEHRWRIAPGRYRVAVGRSSRDIAHTIDVDVEGSGVVGSGVVGSGVEGSGEEGG